MGWVTSAPPAAAAGSDPGARGTRCLFHHHARVCSQELRSENRMSACEEAARPPEPWEPAAGPGPAAAPDRC